MSDSQTQENIRTFWNEVFHGGSAGRQAVETSYEGTIQNDQQLTLDRLWGINSADQESSRNPHVADRSGQEIER